eukprot:735550-Prorocentrum_minimum.AAC.1
MLGLACLQGWTTLGRVAVRHFPPRDGMVANSVCEELAIRGIRLFGTLTAVFTSTRNEPKAKEALLQGNRQGIPAFR